MSFLVPELIRKKRDGGELNNAELDYLVRGFATGAIPDYQIAAWLMAVFFKGLTRAETKIFTEKMKDSGEQIDWRSLHPSFKDFQFADKHSTGGVGDKVSLILAPLGAGLGLKVPMMSGRGLGFTGGTVDKLQSIAGFNMYGDDLVRKRALLESGYCMMAQSDRLAPADRKLYSLRDVTATVESLGLITGSIVAKKWAAGVENIVYDVKCGGAAFMSDLTEARQLAQSLVDISREAGMNAKALVTRMEEPLGDYIGNALEVRESLAILKNDYADEATKLRATPLKALSIRLASEMAVLAGLFSDVASAQARCELLIESGRAYELFELNVRAQQASADWELQLASAPLVVTFNADRAGTVQAVASRQLGLAGIQIGAGRNRSEDQVDPAVGFVMKASVGDEVAVGQPLIECHVRSLEQFESIGPRLRAVFEIAEGGLTHPLSTASSDLVYTEVT